MYNNRIGEIHEYDAARPHIEDELRHIWISWISEKSKQILLTCNVFQK